ncbi:putative FBD-associated F-box protein [Panicum miliaceum]|uniref:FBD-associated F-box protein n=1 Tax=Panicum miliaceum TaxID=4540 RepID=A0A3L6S4P6_PANMI|nr:putative FBD-associated F-box protein [Panicum miliaceum]
MQSTKNVVEEEHTDPSLSTDDSAAGGDDLISRLSNDVIVSILGLVGDAREVVRTGVLSRRWRGLWTRVPVLHLDSGGRPGMERLGISLKVHYAPGEPHLAATTVEAAEGWIRATYLGKVTVRFSVNNYNPESRVDYFLHELLGDDGAWTACEDKSYEWRL